MDDLQIHRLQPDCTDPLKTDLRKIIFDGNLKKLEKRKELAIVSAEAKSKPPDFRINLSFRL